MSKSKVVDIGPPPPLMPVAEAKVGLEACDEARQRLAAGNTKMLMILEDNRDGPRISHAGVSADPLRAIGLLDHAKRDAHDFVDEEYEE
jgi:hypothetical protein